MFFAISLKTDLNDSNYDLSLILNFTFDANDDDFSRLYDGFCTLQFTIKNHDTFNLQPHKTTARIWGKSAVKNRYGYA